MQTHSTPSGHNQFEKRHRLRQRCCGSQTTDLQSAYLLLVFMKKLALAFALPLGGALLIQAGAANAADATVTIDGTDYTISTYTGALSYILANPSLYSLPWFSSYETAEAFSTAVNTQTGMTQEVNTELGDIVLGPIFSYSATGESYTWYNDLSGSFPFTFDPDATYTYAVVNAPAAATPGPLPLLGAAAAFSASRRLRHRISAQTFKL
jgi:hypothetical protein